jgi:hypothetical protein
VKALWIDKVFPPELEDRKGEFKFIQSLPKDNTYLTASYWQELNSLPDDLRKAWVEGDWTVFSGQAFPEWDSRYHIIDPIPLKDVYPKWRAIDYGYSAPWCSLWFCKNLDTNRITVYREAYMTGLTDRQQARMIRSLTPPGETIGLTYADPSMWAVRQAGDVVTTTFDEYLKEGVFLVKADNNRLSGKRKVDRLLADLLDGKPGLQITANCVNLIRTLPTLSYSKSNPEDVDTRQEDHAYDALRYGVTNINLGVMTSDKIKKTESALRNLRNM